jgi:hypothetical protein
MSGRTSAFGWKLAVAAVAVAGVVGTAGAAGDKVTVDSKSIDISLGIDLKGTLDILPNYGEAISLEGFDVLAYKEIDPGNLCALRVTTNGPTWDVSFTTLNGGIPRSQGVGTINIVQNPATDCKTFLSTTVCDSTAVPAPGDYLKYKIPTGGAGLAFTTTDADSSRICSNVNSDTVILDVAIGVAEEIPIAGMGTLFASGASVGGTNNVKPTRIGPSRLRASSTAGGTGTEVLFSERLWKDATAGTTGTTINNNLALLTNVGGRDLTDNTDLAALGSDGFSKIGTGKQYFYVNVGINPGYTSDLKLDAKNKYKETFTFNLKAGY